MDSLIQEAIDRVKTIIPHWISTVIAEVAGGAISEAINGAKAASGMLELSDDDLANAVVDGIGNFLGACAYALCLVENREGVIFGPTLRRLESVGYEKIFGYGLYDPDHQLCQGALQDVERSIAIDGVGVIPTWEKWAIELIKRLEENLSGLDVGVAISLMPTIIGVSGRMKVDLSPGGIEVFGDFRLALLLESIMWAFYEFLRNRNFRVGTA